MQNETNRDILKFELGRKLLHTLFGLISIVILFYSGRLILIALLSMLLTIGSLMVVLRLQGWKIPVALWFEEKFERKGVRFPGYGAFWYVVGVLLLSILLSSSSEVAAGILTLALGDSASTIIGVNARHPLPYNGRKTIEGSIAFFVFALLACLAVGWIGAFLALVTAIVESLPIPFDDNLTIPLAAALFFIIL